MIKKVNEGKNDFVNELLVPHKLEETPAEETPKITNNDWDDKTWKTFLFFILGVIIIGIIIIIK